MLRTSCHEKVPVLSGSLVIAPSPSDSALLEREQIVSVFQEQKRSPAVQNGVASEGCARDRRPACTAGPELLPRLARRHAAFTRALTRNAQAAAARETAGPCPRRGDVFDASTNSLCQGLREQIRPREGGQTPKL